jgi:hypothetical protein
MSNAQTLRAMFYRADIGLPQMMAKMRDLVRAVSFAAVNSQSNSPVLNVLRLPVVKVEVYVCSPTVRRRFHCDPSSRAVLMNIHLAVIWWINYYVAGRRHREKVGKLLSLQGVFM